jgi:hypothetical protein
MGQEMKDQILSDDQVQDIMDLGLTVKDSILEAFAQGYSSGTRDQLQFAKDLKDSK